MNSVKVAYIVRKFDSHFWLVCFSGLKYILAHKMCHNVRQSDDNTRLGLYCVEVYSLN